MGYSQRSALTSRNGDEQTLKWQLQVGTATNWTRILRRDDVETPVAVEAVWVPWRGPGD